MSNKVISYKEAAKLIKDGATVATTTFGLGGLSEQMLVGIEERYAEEHHPKGITFVNSSGIGNNQPGNGLDHLVAEGLVKRLISGHIGSSPLMGQAVINNQVESYLFPQGVITQLYRSIAGKKPGLITKVGLKTYADPRVEGAKGNNKATENLVELVKLNGEEWLNYKNFPIDVALVRGTYADGKGNISIERETGKLESLPLATAARNSGGIVIAQVTKIVENGSIKPKDVSVPGVLVDYVIVSEPENHFQTMGTQYNPALSGEVRIPVNGFKPLKFDLRKIVARRAAMELKPSSVVNLGIGMPDGVAAVAAEEGLGDELTLTLELGAVGGTPATGLDFGAAFNPEAIIDHQAMFDFYDGGGLDLTVLGLAQTDEKGNINVSKFGPRVTGPGGFINISQNTQNIVFVGTFTVGSKATVENGKLVITEQGKAKKFLKQVEQITFSGEYASENNQNVLYVTERAVFDLKDGKMRLIEIAPGVDLQKDILDWMDFEPVIAEDLKEMNPDIFNETWGKLKDIVLK